MNMSLLVFSGFFDARTILKLPVCKKYPAHKIPASGEKFVLKRTNVRMELSHCVWSESAALPTTKVVLPIAINPIATMKLMSSTRKMTP